MVKSKKNKEAVAEEQGDGLTIKNIVQLRKLWEDGTLPAKISVALKTKLVQLIEGGEAHPLEKELFLDIFQAERFAGTLLPVHEYVLNKVESDDCTQLCKVKTSDIAPVHKLVIDQVMKFKREIGRPDKFKQIRKYVVYPVRIIPPSAQVKREVRERIAAGVQVDPATFPAEKQQYRRIVLNEKEFNRIMEVTTKDELETEDALLALDSLPEEETEEEVEIVLE